MTQQDSYTTVSMADTLNDPELTATLYVKDENTYVCIDSVSTHALEGAILYRIEDDKVTLYGKFEAYTPPIPFEEIVKVFPTAVNSGFYTYTVTLPPVEEMCLSFKLQHSVGPHPTLALSLSARQLDIHVVSKVTEYTSKGLYEAAARCVEEAENRWLTYDAGTAALFTQAREMLD